MNLTEYIISNKLTREQLKNIFQQNRAINMDYTYFERSSKLNTEEKRELLLKIYKQGINIIINDACL